MEIAKKNSSFWLGGEMPFAQRPIPGNALEINELDIASLFDSSHPQEHNTSYTDLSW